MKRSTKITSIILIFFIVIAIIIIGRLLIANHFKKKFSKVPPPGIIVKSVVEYIVYYHPDGEIAVGYTDWAKHMNYNDNVNIDITTQEVSNWVKNNYGLGG